MLTFWKNSSTQLRLNGEQLLEANSHSGVNLDFDCAILTFNYPLIKPFNGKFDSISRVVVLLEGECLHYSVILPLLRVTHVSQVGKSFTFLSILTRACSHIVLLHLLDCLWQTNSFQLGLPEDLCSSSKVTKGLTACIVT